MSAAIVAGADIEARAGERLLREPPVLGDWRRSDLKGDHALTPGAWTMPGEDGPPRVAAVLIAVVDHPGAPTILLTERVASLRQHSGQIAFPGGKMDPEDATPLATALREAREEVGLDPVLVRPIGYLDAYLSGTNYFVIPVLGLVRPGFALTLNRHEVESVFEVPLTFLMNEGNHEIHARDLRERIRSYYAMPFGDRYIWGVTAGILRNMYERLYGR